MKMLWVGTEGEIKGNVEFITDKGQIVVLTAEEIKTLYETSMKNITT